MRWLWFAILDTFLAVVLLGGCVFLLFKLSDMMRLLWSILGAL